MGAPMPNSKPALLIIQPHLGVLAPYLEQDFTVWRLWEGPPLEAVSVIRALVVAGEFAIDKAFAESLPNLGLIACFTAGYDGIDLAWARARGLQVSHSPGANHEDVADHAFGLIIASWRRIVEGDRKLRSGEWTPTGKMLTPSLGGRSLGIVGLGDIGAAVAARAGASACGSPGGGHARSQMRHGPGPSTFRRWRLKAISWWLPAAPRMRVVA